MKNTITQSTERQVEAILREAARLQTLATAFDAAVEKFGKENLARALCETQAVASA